MFGQRRTILILFLLFGVTFASSGFSEKVFSAREFSTIINDKAGVTADIHPFDPAVPESQEDGPVLQVSQDLVVQASAATLLPDGIPGVEKFEGLRDQNALRSTPFKKVCLFKRLFQSVISPNAP